MELARSYSIIRAEKFWRRKPIPEYVELVRKCFGEAEARRIELCGKQSMKYVCVGDSVHFGWKPMCCRSQLCPFCSGTDTKRLCQYFMYRIHEIHGKLHRKIRFYRYEFGVPPPLRKEVGMKGLADLDKLAHEAILEYLGKPRGMKLGIVQVAQWFHSFNPSFRRWNVFSGVYPHVHGVCFDFAFDGERVVPFGRMFISEDKGFVRLRALWRSKLEAHFGKSGWRDVDCYIRYEEGGDQLRHRLAYMLRSPMKDFYETIQNEGVPLEYDVGWIREMLHGRGHAQRVHYYGWLAPVCQSSKSPFMRSIGLELLNRRLYDVEQKKTYCPKCNCLMEAIRYAIEDTDELITRGEQFIVSVPPWMVLRLGNG